MSHQRSFEIVCPNNHNQTVKFTHEGFEEILKSDELVFHCNTCDTDWTPLGETIAGIRKAFRHDSAS